MQAFLRGFHRSWRDQYRAFGQACGRDRPRL